MSQKSIAFWEIMRKVLCPKSSANMIEDSEKGKRQLAFELQNSNVFEKRITLSPVSHCFV